MSLARMPTVFVPHGGGPFPLLNDPTHTSLSKFLRSVKTLVPKPKAIVLATAHWEERVPTVSAAPRPELYFDYYGFPPETYKYKYPAPGSPELAQKVSSLLTDAGLGCRQDTERGWDHGTFVPMMLMFPEGDVPLVQLSLVAGLDPATHLRMGQALAPLRDEGVLIIGSGMSFHNMGTLQRNWGTPDGQLGSRPSKDFDDFLQHACTGLTGAARSKRLEAWGAAPGGKQSHPREEHLIPLLVAAGAALDDSGTCVYSRPMMGVQISGFQFGTGAAAARPDQS